MSSMIKLELEWKKQDSTPSRMLATCPYEAKDLFKSASYGTASFRKKSGKWSLPLEPILAHRIMKVFGEENVDMNLELKAYFVEQKQTRQVVRQAALDETPVERVKGLRPYQNAATRFLLAGGRVTLALDMGLGKTVVSCAGIKEQDLRRVIVICPNNTKLNWAMHLSEWADIDPIVIESGYRSDPLYTEYGITRYEGNTSQQSEFIMDYADTDKYGLVLNYYHLREHHPLLQRIGPSVVIIDEAHRIKNRQSTQTQAAWKVAKGLSYVWLLTGTPLRRDYDDYYSLLHTCDPIRFGGYWNFVSTFLETIPAQYGGIEIIGLRDHDRFNRILSGYLMRKEKHDVMKDMPEKVYEDYPLNLTDEQEKLYAKMKKEFFLMIQEQLDNGETLEKILIAENVAAQLVRLRQICLTPEILGHKAPSAKLKALKELASDLKEYQESFIIFTCYKKFIPFIEEILKELDIPYGKIVGGQHYRERENAERGLNNGTLKAIIGTIPAMGEGLNLQKATTAVFTDIDWTPAANRQAEDRIHRGDITEPRTIIRLYHPGTVEQHIRSVNYRKDRITDATLGQVEAVRRMMNDDSP